MAMHPFLKLSEHLFKNLFLRFGIAIVSWGIVVFIEQSIEMYLKIPNEAGYWSSLWIIAIILYSAIFASICLMLEFLLKIKTLNLKQMFLLYIFASAFSFATMYYGNSLNLSATWIPLFIELCIPLIIGYVCLKLIQISKGR